MQLLALGSGYFLWIRLTGLAVPCIFRRATGWLCPGCGVTTLFLKLVKLDFAGAFEANPFLLVTGPFLLDELFCGDMISRRGGRAAVWNQRILVFYGIGLLVFGVLRNL